MNHRRCHLLIIALCLIASAAMAQLNLPTTTRNGQQYYYYKVKSKETLYGISHKLHISQEEIVKYNPASASGLKDKQLLFFPVADFNKSTAVADRPVTAVVPEVAEFTHTVEPGETLFGISRTYGMSVDEIIEQNPELKSNSLKSGMSLHLSKSRQDTIFVTIQPGNTLFSTAKRYNTTVEQIMSENPGITPSNFKAGEVIRIAPNSAIPVEKEEIVTKYYPYEVKKGDTYAIIAENNGISISELKEANPNVDKLKKGETIYIPRQQTETVMVSPFVNADSSQMKIKEIYQSVHMSKQDNTINVALLLPFMLNADNPTKQARLFTEFYKGFLLAVNDLRNRTSKQINIFAYDTENSLSAISKLLEMDSMKQMDMIFAPDNSEQISLIAAFGKENNVNIINTFSTKNEEYIDNSRIFHLNAPNTYMNIKVIDWIKSQFEGYDIVFLNNSENESKEIVAQIKQCLQSSHRIHDYGYATSLNSDELSETLKEGVKYLFIPNSGSKSDLLRIAPALASIKENRTDIELSLFGYPEWSTYLNVCESNLKKIDTYFYSRFFINENDYDTKQLRNNFSRWYGEDMIYAAPQFGMLGYDTGFFFLKAYIDENPSFSDSRFTGIQTDFRLERISNWSGMVNKAVYIVHLSSIDGISRILR